jgi:hypothetical protein
MKSTKTYWNPLDLNHKNKWEEVEGTNGNISFITLAIDEKTGDYTRLTKFLNGYSSDFLGPKSHDYPEEIFIISGRLFDKAFGIWLEKGHYASRPPGEVHGPFISEGDTYVLEISFPSQSIR